MVLLSKSFIHQIVHFFYFVACMIIKGDFDLHIRTASKYDDSRVLHFPGFEVRYVIDFMHILKFFSISLEPKQDWDKD